MLQWYELSKAFSLRTQKVELAQICLPDPLLKNASGLSMTLTLICRSRGVSEDQRLNTRTSDGHVYLEGSHGATLLSTGLACRRIVGASRDVADGVDVNDGENVDAFRLLFSWEHKNATTKASRNAVAKAWHADADRGEKTSLLGVTSSVSPTLDNLTPCFDRCQTGASNNKGTLLDKREQQLSWCFDAPSYHLASPGHEELPVDVIQADPHIFSDILRNEETAQICLNFSSDGYPCV
ncbi:hypothetical protein KCV06_g559, partial [Aureobasidium melanogenum]